MPIDPTLLLNRLACDFARHSLQPIPHNQGSIGPGPYPRRPTITHARSRTQLQFPTHHATRNNR